MVGGPFPATMLLIPAIGIVGNFASHQIPRRDIAFIGICNSWFYGNLIYMHYDKENYY
jgi:hypothetical protein